VLASRPDVLTFETAPLEEDVEVIGAMTAEIYVSADAPDTDLWVKVLDVAPDGTAWNIMSPGLDVIRASYRDTTAGRQLLTPGRVYLLRLGDLLTANEFKKGHRIRVSVSATFFPHFSRNLHTGELELRTSCAEDGTLHPVQQAFRDCHGLQCGFCTPGILMTLTELLRDNPSPDEAEIRDTLSGNLCRCTGYVGIVESIKAAAEKMRGN
jgi:hypothetical protein